MSKNQLKIGREPIKLLATSEPYVLFSKMGYSPIINVMSVKDKREYFIYISAKSIAIPLEQKRTENNNIFTGLEFWIYRDGDKKISPYVVE